MSDMSEAQQEAFTRLKPSQLASGTVLQEAIEGGGGARYRIRAIYLNTADVGLLDRHPPKATPAVRNDFPEGTAQTAAEYRGIVAAMAAGNHQVDIYIAHSAGLSKVPAGRQIVEGAPLPAELRPHLPPSFATASPAPPSGGGGGTPQVKSSGGAKPAIEAGAQSPDAGGVGAGPAAKTAAPARQDHEGLVTIDSAGGPGRPSRRVGRVNPAGLAEPESEEEDAGGGITQDEIEALTTPDAFEAMSGRGNWSLFTLIGSAALQKYMTSMAEGIEQATIRLVNERVASALATHVADIVALQKKGDIAYAQVTVTKTVADGLTVFDLKSVDVSEWFRQGTQTEGGVSGVLGNGMGIRVTHETMSFALSLHPVVLAWAMTQLNGRLREVDAKLLGMTRAGQEAPAALRERYRALRTCADRLARLGPRTPSIAHVAGDCLDLHLAGAGTR